MILAGLYKFLSENGCGRCCLIETDIEKKISLEEKVPVAL